VRRTAVVKATAVFSSSTYVQFKFACANLALMSSDGSPTLRQRLSSGSLWSRDPEYRSIVASGAGFASMLTAQRDERGRFKRAMNCAPTCAPQPPSAEWWMAL
jgi:hypothetical protein